MQFSQTDQWGQHRSMSSVARLTGFVCFSTEALHLRMRTCTHVGVFNRQKCPSLPVPTYITVPSLKHAQSWRDITFTVNYERLQSVTSGCSPGRCCLGRPMFRANCPREDQEERHVWPQVIKAVVFITFPVGNYAISMCYDCSRFPLRYRIVCCFLCKHMKRFFVR